MSSKCPCCKQLVPYGHNCDYPVMGLINEFGGITTEAKKQEEIEQAREETRQQCADTYMKHCPKNIRSNKIILFVRDAIRNSGQDKGEDK